MSGKEGHRAREVPVACVAVTETSSPLLSLPSRGTDHVCTGSACPSGCGPRPAPHGDPPGTHAGTRRSWRETPVDPSARPAECGERRVAVAATEARVLTPALPPSQTDLPCQPPVAASRSTADRRDLRRQTFTLTVPVASKPAAASAGGSGRGPPGTRRLGHQQLRPPAGVAGAAAASSVLAHVAVSRALGPRHADRFSLRGGWRPQSCMLSVTRPALAPRGDYTGV